MEQVSAKSEEATGDSANRRTELREEREVMMMQQQRRQQQQHERRDMTEDEERDVEWNLHKVADLTYRLQAVQEKVLWTVQVDQEQRSFSSVLRGREKSGPLLW